MLNREIVGFSGVNLLCETSLTKLHTRVRMTDGEFHVTLKKSIINT